VQITARFTNLGAVLQSLGTLHKEIQGAHAAELYQSAEIVMTAAKELTPVDTGALRASGHVQEPKIEGGTVSVELGFGGPSVDYAEIVHEDLNANHAVGQAKFLEQPFMQMQPEIQKRLDQAVEEAIRKAGL